MTYELPLARGYDPNRLAKAMISPDIHIADKVPGQAIRNRSSPYRLRFTTILRLAESAVCRLDRNSFLSVGSDKNGRLTNNIR